jgi:signal peptidase I
MTPESGAPWAPPRPPRPSRGRAGRITFWAVFGLVAVCLVSSLVGVFLTYRTYYMPSGAGSMENTLIPNDRMLVQRGQDVRRGDIVVYTIPPGSGAQLPAGTYTKRLIGLPGDRVACCDAVGDVTVNGKALHEQAYLHPGDKPSAFSFSVTLGPGQMWVMGDHRAISNDSREYGAVPTADITGRVYAVKGSPFTAVNVTTPATFVADGLAPPDHRRPPLAASLTGISTMLLLLLLVLAALGVIRWTLRRRRARREAVAFWPVP